MILDLDQHTHLPASRPIQSASGHVQQEDATRQSLLNAYTYSSFLTAYITHSLLPNLDLDSPSTAS